MTEKRKLFLVVREELDFFNILGAFPEASGAEAEADIRNIRDTRFSHLAMQVIADPGSASGTWSVDLHMSEKVSSNSYNTVATFLFPGSNSVNSPVLFSAVGEVNASSKEGFARIFDVTNGVVLTGELFWDGDTDPTIKKTTSFPNIPTEEAVLELQIKTGTGGNFTIRYIELR